MGYYITRCFSCGLEFARGVKRCPHCGKSSGFLSRMLIILRYKLKIRGRR